MDSWREVVDPVALMRWMDAHALGTGPILDIVPLGGGTQNVLIRFRRDERHYVLRRPPLHLRVDSNRTMAREARMLGALAGSAVPHPGLIAACLDEGVLGAAFYLMQPVDGINAAATMTPLHSEPSVQHRMGLAMVDAIVALGEVDHVAAGLSDFGKADGYLRRQVQRWGRQLESYRAFPDWPGPGLLPGLARIQLWLDAHCPQSFRPGIIHGDYHLANVMFRHDGPELAAIIDWELTTIGDPLIDLGWMVATWSDGDGDTPVVEVNPWRGFPKTFELVARYAERSSRDLSAIGWYIVLACYKLGILLEGTYARASAGRAAAETGAQLHSGAIRLFERALRRIDRADADGVIAPAAAAVYRCHT